jgi:hypothetical protein
MQQDASRKSLQRRHYFDLVAQSRAQTQFPAIPSARHGRIEAALVRNGREAVGQPHHCLGRAEHEIAVGRGDLRKPVEEIDIRLLVEIDEDVAAEDQIYIEVSVPCAGYVCSAVSLAGSIESINPLRK